MSRSAHIALTLLIAGCGGPDASTRAANKAAAAGSAAGSGTGDGATHAVSGTPVPTAPAGERLYVVRDGSIWSMAPDGKDPDQITVRRLETPDENPTVSPDGTMLVYATTREDVHPLIAINLEDRIEAVLTDGKDGGDDLPTFSPRGDRIAFVRGDPRDRRDICIYDTKTKKVEVVVIGFDDDPEWVGFPSFSPDGSRLVFSADRRKGQGTNLWLFDVARKKLTRLTKARAAAPFTADIDPDWSPDGRRIVFASNRHVSSADDSGDFDIYAVNPDGSGLSRLTRDPGTATQPAYSTDGKRVFFTSTRDRRHAFETEVYVMARAGGRQERLTRDERPQNSSAVSAIGQ